MLSDEPRWHVFQMTAKGIAPFLLTIVRLLYAESKNFSFGCFLKRSYCEECTGSVRTACKSAYRVLKQHQHMLARCIETRDYVFAVTRAAKIDGGLDDGEKIRAVVAFIGHIAV